jgi:hypothetical protein
VEMSVSDKSVLIVSNPDDWGTAPVSWALQQGGVDVTTWNWRAFPGSSTGAIRLHTSDCQRDRLSINADVLPELLESVWFRRPGIPTPSPDTHDADIHYVERESRSYLLGALQVLRARRWVNPPHRAAAAENKLLQLRLARLSGFAIPETLITNDPDILQKFYRERSNDIVHKSFAPMTWEGAGSHSCAATTRVTAEVIDNRDAIALCPGIYQSRIDKDHEIRVTVMGSQLIAVALYSQARGPNDDWRPEQTFGRLRGELISLPPEVAARCHKLCAELGITYGAIDIAVSREGECVFFEANQSGNFLFLDDVDPQCRALERFCCLLAGSTSNPDQFPSLQEFLSTDVAMEFMLRRPKTVPPEEKLHVARE